MRSMLLIAPLILVGAGLVGYWLAGTTLRPVQGIMDEVDAISDGRSLHRRVAVPLSGDEMARLALTVNGMLARLEQSFESLHRFTADASHELKTPLMVLRAGVERALTHPGMPAEILQSLDESLAQINQMTEMVESLLTLARADEGRAPLAVEESDLRELVADVAETAGMLGEESVWRRFMRCPRTRFGWRSTATGSVRCCSTSSPTPSSTPLREALSRSTLSRMTTPSSLPCAILGSELPPAICLTSSTGSGEPIQPAHGRVTGLAPASASRSQVDRRGAWRIDHGAEPAGAGDHLPGSAPKILQNTGGGFLIAAS